MSRLPLRIRITLAFAGAMAILLVAVGLFLYFELEARLDESIDNGLRSRATEVSALVRASESGLGGSEGGLIEQEESFAQVLTPGGRVVDSTSLLGAQALLSAEELEQAAATPTFFEREQVTGIDEPARLLATPVDVGGRERIAVVGAALDDRDEALESLAALLLIGGPVALLLASLVGYGATGAALRPVEAMRRRAAAISAREPDERLPVPEAKDELRRLGETLNEMLGRLEDALMRERRFVDDASHELRTPLTLHKTELELALRHASSTTELRAAISSAIEEIDRLIQLAEDLLVVARSEEGRIPLTLEPLSVGELLSAVSERFRTRADEAGRRLVVNTDGGLVIEGDRIRLEQALMCLVENALRYGAGQIRLWARGDGRFTALHVSDQGPGFPAEFVGRAFERFSRADAARAGGGVGLGLAIVETIARAHGGRAVAANDRDGGADVWIEIPTAPR
jgi:two-component system, OmpR family, sensor kinase